MNISESQILKNENSALRTENMIQQEYMTILEKTNQQLGTWSNPYGIMVGILSLLIAIIGISVAFYIFKQSRDYKKQLEENRNNYEDKLKGFLASWEEILNEKTSQYNNLLDTTQDIINKNQEILTTTTEEGKKAILDVIDNLKLEQKKLMTQEYIPTAIVEPYDVSSGMFSYIQRNVVKCTKCFKSFYGRNNDYNVAAVALSRKDARCPYCGTICYVD